MLEAGLKRDCSVCFHSPIAVDRSSTLQGREIALGWPVICMPMYQRCAALLTCMNAHLTALVLTSVTEVIIFGAYAYHTSEPEYNCICITISYMLESEWRLINLAAA